MVKGKKEEENEAVAESPTSVLSEEVSTCSSPTVYLALLVSNLLESSCFIWKQKVWGLPIDIKICCQAASMASDVPTITEEMLEEEKRLAEERAHQEAVEAEALLKTAPKLETTTFSKLDELLNQTQIYSQFLLEQMDDIALVSIFTH